MITTHLEITATRSFKHPLDPDTTLAPQVKLTAHLTKSDNLHDAALILQDKAEELVQKQQYLILRSIELAQAGMTDDYTGDPLARAFLNTEKCTSSIRENDAKRNRTT